MSVSISHDLETLDELLAALAASPEPEARLVEEHVQFARAYLLGAMPVEYETNLGMARHAAAKIPDAATKARAMELIENLVSAYQQR